MTILDGGASITVRNTLFSSTSTPPAAASGPAHPAVLEQMDGDEPKTKMKWTDKLTTFLIFEYGEYDETIPMKKKKYQTFV